MDIALLVLVFMAAIVVSGCVVLAFSGSIEGVLSMLATGGLAEAWSKYAKFALFVATFTGGLRLRELESVPILLQPASGEMALGLRQCLLEVFKTVAGALGSASWTLLVFFGASLAAYLTLRGYHSLKTMRPRQAHPADHHTAAPAGRL